MAEFAMTGHTLLEQITNYNKAHFQKNPICHFKKTPILSLTSPTRQKLIHFSIHVVLSFFLLTFDGSPLEPTSGVARDIAMYRPHFFYSVRGMPLRKLLIS